MLIADRPLLDRLTNIADAAGQAIMAIYQHPVTVAIKADRSPLTEADLQADDCIRNHLHSAFPAVAILSEESATLPSTASSEYFLVDPLDGTKEFINRNGEFTVNIALIQHGKPVAGVVLAPALDELFLAATGLGAWKRVNGVFSPLSLTPRRIDKTQTLRILGSRSHGSPTMEAWLHGLDCAYELLAIGSSLKFCRLAENSADVYPRLGPTSQWDTAAGQCILETAGGSVLSTSGEPLRYGLELPILNPHFFAVGNITTNSLLPIARTDKPEPNTVIPML